MSVWGLCCLWATCVRSWVAAGLLTDLGVNRIFWNFCIFLYGVTLGNDSSKYYTSTCHVLPKVYLFGCSIVEISRHVKIDRFF
jgi:hypothetical protein